MGVHHVCVLYYFSWVPSTRPATAETRGDGRKKTMRDSMCGAYMVRV